jgi:hypothetical protein
MRPTTSAQRRDLLRLIARLDNLLGATDDQYCTCGHESVLHERGTGACHGLDSYEVRCTCPSLEPDLIEGEGDASG